MNDASVLLFPVRGKGYRRRDGECEMIRGGKPSFVSIGPNMKKMIENGELDVEEIKKEFDKLGIKMLFF